MSDNVVEADVIIIGGGASGITAAVAAAEKDASVIVLEKGSTTGGAANMGMGFFAVESKYQKAQMVDLTQEDAFRFLMEYTHWRVDARLVRKYIAQSADTIDWIETMGVEFLGAFKYFATSKQTWHVVKTAGLERSGRARCVEPVQGAHRAGRGARREDPVPHQGDQDRASRTAAWPASSGSARTAPPPLGECNAVIVATGGFGNNPKMIHDKLGYDWGKDLHSFRIPGVDGDGLRMLWEAGAGHDRLDDGAHLHHARRDRRLQDDLGDDAPAQPDGQPRRPAVHQRGDHEQHRLHRQRGGAAARAGRRSRSSTTRSSTTTGPRVWTT